MYRNSLDVHTDLYSTPWVILCCAPRRVVHLVTQLLRAYLRSKIDKREVYEFDLPLMGPQPRILGRTI